MLPSDDDAVGREFEDREVTGGHDEMRDEEGTLALVSL